MKALRLGLLLALAVAAWASYTYYYSDNLTSINLSYWRQIGNVAASANGLVAVNGSGALVSTVAAPDGNDYDIQLKVHAAYPPSCMSQFSLYARAAADLSTYYQLQSSPSGWQLAKKTSGGTTYLANITNTCYDGMVMRMVVRGSQIQIWSAAPMPTVITDSDLPTGQPGVGVAYGQDAVTNVKFGPIDHVAPPAIPQSSIISVASLHRVDLQWPVGSADVNSPGLAGYSVSRDGVLLGSTPTAIPEWWDETVTAGQTSTYSLSAFDQQGNYSAATTYTVTIPTSPGDQSRIGVRPDGSYWGGAGEQIDLQSGNLNFSLPLLKVLGRSDLSLPIGLSYNSQFWRYGADAPWFLGQDLGLGPGWKLQAGSVRPVWFNGSVHHWVYSDATGAEYILDQNNNNVWTSLDGTFAAYDATAGKLHFPDGSFWYMGSVSGSGEGDAGWLYPTTIESANGNQIQLQYAPQLGYPWNGSNTSSRIATISDPRGSGNATYTFTYASYSMRLTAISNAVGTSESYGFSVGNQCWVDPFTGQSWNGQCFNSLGSVTVNGLNVSHSFQYDNSGEMTQVTAPLGGILQWAYRTYNFSGGGTYAGSGRSYREVTTRWLKTSSSGTQYEWDLVMANGASWHPQSTLTDVGAGTKKVWTFSTSANSFPGLVTAYEEQTGAGTALVHKDYTWTHSYYGNYGTGNAYVQTVQTTLNPGTGSAATKTTQMLDQYGNIMTQQIYDYGNLSSPARTYNYSYLSNSNYATRYIFNKLYQATLSDANGHNTTLVTNYYDGSTYTVCPAMTATQAAHLHDAAYDTNWVYRGNVTQTIGTNSADIKCFSYDSAGMLQQAQDAMGHTITVAPAATTDFSLPGAVTPNGNNAMATSMTYAVSFAVASVMGPNQAQATTTYDQYGRPQQSSIPDGAVTTYGYTYNPPTQTATVNGRWQVTTLDGFGRTTQVDSGHDSVSLANTVSRVLTQYAPCACSPLLKVWRVSQPFNPNGGSPVWTTYSYDATGRTISVTAPDGVSTTQTSYSGNNTTVTDAAGKWKTSTTDVFGNLILVTEPNPAGGTFTTTYTYTPLNQLTGVSMTRGTVTETRTFLYTGSDLTSATNPENGTVTYTYDASHHVTTRTDAMGSRTVYSYDSYGRLAEIQYYPGSGSYYPNEDPNQRVTYYYDGAYPAQFYPSNQSPMGRLTGVAFGGGVQDAYHDSYEYMYVYNQAGRVTTQEMAIAGQPNQGYYNGITFIASYQWDNEGRMTSLQYPTVHAVGSFGNLDALMPIGGFQYDTNGRLSTITMDRRDGSGPQSLASATYTASGQLSNMVLGGWSETFTYNSLNQLTNQSVQGVLNLTYNYSATQNNGRITGLVDGITGENTSYTYDALNRLSTAAAASKWSESYSYDGFGNLLTKSGSGGSPNPAPSWSASYNGKNQLTSSSYDANGNMTSANGGAQYNVENRMVYTNGNGTATFAYDPWGKRVMANSGGASGMYTYTFYGVTGQALAILQCNGASFPGYPACAIVGQNVYLGSRMIVSGGVNVLTDRLGNIRANGQGESFAYYPYGEERTSTVDGRPKFGTYFRDGMGQDYADQRYYNAGMGRFWSADPGGVKTAGAGDPGSWNRYSYVEGDPVNFLDGSGRERNIPDGPMGPGGGPNELLPEQPDQDQPGGGNPCQGIAKAMRDTINGVGMPGGKSLLTRVVQQIVGQSGKVFDSHQEQIDGYINRLKNLRKQWYKNGCDDDDQDPPYGVDLWISEVSAGALKAAQKQYQEYLADSQEILAGTATAGIIAQAASLVTSISEFLESLGGGWELVLAAAM